MEIYAPSQTLSHLSCAKDLQDGVNIKGKFVLCDLEEIYENSFAYFVFTRPICAHVTKFCLKVAKHRINLFE